MKTLYVNGDSWTEGDELGLPYEENETELYRFYNSWGGQLHKLLGTIMHFNDGKGGTSNHRIFRRTIKFIREYSKRADPTQLVVAVCWTTLDRDEIPVDIIPYSMSSSRLQPGNIPLGFHGMNRPCSNDPIEGIGWYIPIQMYGVNLPHYSSINKLNDTTITALKQMEKPYTVTIGSKSRSEEQYLRMWNLKQICNSLEIKLVQSWALEDGEFEPGSNDFVEEYMDDIQYLPEIFIKFCRKNNYPLGPGGHCLEVGHENWAKYIYENI